MDEQSLLPKSRAFALKVAFLIVPIVAGIGCDEQTYEELEGYQERCEIADNGNAETCDGLDEAVDYGEDYTPGSFYGDGVSDGGDIEPVTGFCLSEELECAEGAGASGDHGACEGFTGEAACNQLICRWCLPEPPAPEPPAPEPPAPEPPAPVPPAPEPPAVDEDIEPVTGFCLSEELECAEGPGASGDHEACEGFTTEAACNQLICRWCLPVPPAIE